MSVERKLCLSVSVIEKSVCLALIRRKSCCAFLAASAFRTAIMRAARLRGVPFTKQISQTARLQETPPKQAIFDGT